MAQSNPPSVVERARSIAATLDTPTKGGQLRAKKGPLERSSSENMKGDPDALRRISAIGLRNDGAIVYAKGDSACIPLARSISNVRRLIFNRRCESQLILVEAPAATPRPKETLQKRAVTTPVAPLSPTRRALLECVGAPSPLLRYDGHVTRFAPAEFADHEAFRTAFQFFDTDRDGTLSATELVEVLSRFGVNTTEENVSLMLHTMDFNGRGRVGFGEFLELMKEASGESESNMGAMDPLDDTAQRRVFESLDSDSDGFLSRDDLFKLWSMLGESEEPQEENDEITAASTQDGDSKEATPTPPQSAEATSFVERMLAFADVDKDGKLSYAEFVRVIETPPESWM